MSAAKAGSPWMTLDMRPRSMSGSAVKASTWLAIALNGGRLHSLTGMVTTSVWKSISGAVLPAHRAVLALASGRIGEKGALPGGGSRSSSLLWLRQIGGEER